MPILEDEFAWKISIVDDENIWFGALNLWTRHIGLEQALVNLVKESELIEKKEKHEEIVKEIKGIKESLDHKATELKRWEIELKEKEKQIDK